MSGRNLLPHRWQSRVHHVPGREHRAQRWQFQLHVHRDNVLTDLSGLHARLRGVIDGVA